MTIEQIRIATSKALLEGDGWPPSLPEFIKYGKDNGIDTDESFDRFINKEELSDIEYAAAQEVGYKCRSRLPEDKARREWKKTVLKYAKRAEEGTLPNRKQKAIAQTKKTVAKDWLAPNGNYYRCPSEYYAEKLNNRGE